MGVRGELFSTKVSLQNRTYFFNVKENRVGDLYLNIVESKNRDEGGFERQSVILFAEDLQEFLKGFDESLKILEKAVREKRRGKPARAGAPRDEPVSSERQSARPPEYDEERKRPAREQEDKPQGFAPRGRAGRDFPPEGRSRFPRERPEGRGSGTGFRGMRGKRNEEKPPRWSERQENPRSAGARTGAPRTGGRTRDKEESFPKKRVVIKKRY